MHLSRQIDSLRNLLVIGFIRCLIVNSTITTVSEWSIKYIIDWGSLVSLSITVIINNYILLWSSLIIIQWNILRKTWLTTVKLVCGLCVTCEFETLSVFAFLHTSFYTSFFFRTLSFYKVLLFWKRWIIVFLKRNIYVYH